jgi:hypothetical protein
MKHSNLVPIPKRLVDPFNRLSSDDFLRQIEVLDSSHLTTSLIEILELTETILQNNKGMMDIDIVTHECILTEFLKRMTALVSGETKTSDYGLTMEDKT